MRRDLGGAPPARPSSRTSRAPGGRSDRSARATGRRRHSAGSVVPGPARRRHRDYRERAVRQARPATRHRRRTTASANGASPRRRPRRPRLLRAQGQTGWAPDVQASNSGRSFRRSYETAYRQNMATPAAVWDPAHRNVCRRDCGGGGILRRHSHLGAIDRMSVNKAPQSKFGWRLRVRIGL